MSADVRPLPGRARSRRPEPKIPSDERIAAEDERHGAERKEGTERDRILGVRSRPQHERHTHQGSREGRQQHGERHGSPTEEGADHTEQLDVAPAHALAARPRVVRPRHGEQQSTPRDDADRRRYRSRLATKRENEPNDDAGKADDVGDDPMIQIDECDDDQRGEEQKENKPFHAEADSSVERHRGERGQQLDDEVTKRDRRVATPASPTEHDPADERDVVVPSHRLLALGAPGTGEYDRFLRRNSHDADVGEAADHRAEQEEARRHKG